ncbi:LAMI_0F01662g1_1 [Lachancea mirantina]|uniref:LAMI_0F01662g1_1 n=1 Tax=Lachancea mirantina TaxID=1230905 RepID=A0A1G4JW26_9SACH|nr:LAMI_0F01662g1_1 [Lachancea mirantina]
MSVQFPPSSPARVLEHEKGQGDHEDPFFQPSVKPLAATIDFFQKREIKPPRRFVNRRSTEYPTPNPSSTLDRSSSPVRIRNSSPPESRAAAKEGRHRKTTRGFKISIFLDALSGSRISVGRSTTLCDILLPRHKSISRHHAYVSYLSETEQVKLECTGSNGLIVDIPHRLDLPLLRCASDSLVYEFSQNTDQPRLSDREIVQDEENTSFVMFKGETVLMPFFKDTVIDFRQNMQAFLSLTSDEEAENATETEDELEALRLPNGSFYHSVTTSQKGGQSQIDLLSTPPRTNTLMEHQEEIRLEPATLTTPEMLPIMVTSLTPSLYKGTRTKAAHTTIEQGTCLQAKEPGVNSEEMVADPISIRRRKFESPSPKKNHKRKNQIAGKDATPEEIVSCLISKNVPIVELQNVLINYLAFSNVQQVPLSLLKDVNSKISALDTSELRALLVTEKCIGVIRRQGKDAAGKPLDEEYYYDLENDPDTDRRMLVTSLKGGRSGLRNCRKTHKQYFWKKPAK